MQGAVNTSSRTIQRTLGDQGHEGKYTMTNVVLEGLL